MSPDRMLHAARVAAQPERDAFRPVWHASARGGPAGVHAASGAAVAVLDTGIDLSHPDLVARPGANCIGPGPPEDDDGHGTFVAGVIGARNDGAGVVGVAPGTAAVRREGARSANGYGLRRPRSSAASTG